MTPFTAVHISSVHFVPAASHEKSSGLLGWVRCEYGDLRLDSIAVRRTLDGRLALSFPARTDHSGRRHAYVRPLGDAVRKAIEAQVFRALELSGTVR